VGSERHTLHRDEHGEGVSRDGAATSRNAAAGECLAAIPGPDKNGTP
jgi:hypothetical protein